MELLQQNFNFQSKRKTEAIILGFNQSSQMLYVIFPTVKNFPIRSRYVSLIFKAFVMFMTFLLLQINLYIDLVWKKNPKNNAHTHLFKAKDPKQKKPTPSATFYI